MNRKKELKYLTAFGILSVVAVGLMTNFKFNDLEVQMHDSYFVISPTKAVMSSTLTMWTIKNFYLLVDIIAEKYKVLAVVVAIINPIAGLFMIILIYFNLNQITTSDQRYAISSLPQQIIPICILLALVVVQVTIQIRMIKKLKGLMN
jgi:hypothetical protein